MASGGGKREESLKVYVRVRPPIFKEVKHDSAVAVQGDEAITVFTDSKETTCTYDHVFSEVSEQDEVFSKVKPLLVDVLSGINSCIFAYGQTSSGKSFPQIKYNGKVN
jgi:kinesin family protein 15